MKERMKILVKWTVGKKEDIDVKICFAQTDSTSLQATELFFFITPAKSCEKRE